MIFYLITFFINHGHENSIGPLTAKKYFILKYFIFIDSWLQYKSIAEAIPRIYSKQLNSV